ncbi:MAG: tRNA pseudouridine(38-40) synthase TruA [Marmoricola sp.]
MRVRLDLAYDGTGFKGWARQPALRTVQGELEGALDTVLRTEGSTVTVAGRTDTGVHARGQVAHLDVDGAVLDKAAGRAGDSVASLVRRVNGVLDADVRLLGARVAPEGFDARFSAIWRRYAYRIVDDPALVDPLTRHHVLSWPRPLDQEAMQAASARLVGFHDFAAFCKKREGATTIRTLLDLDWVRADGVLVARVRADAFCHSMVRALVGCLVAVGEGRQTPQWAEAVLAGRERTPGFSVAPAHGLTLEEVGYPDDDQLAAQAEQARARREPLDPPDRVEA